jgi:hypothetical protein
MTVLFAPVAASAASITVWEQANFRGASTVVDDSVRQLSDFGWNDRISSLRIDSGQWQICRDADFRACRTVDAGEVASLDATWNDTISSLRLVGTTSTTSTGNAGDSTVGYTHEDTARRVYRALLGHDPDYGGLRAATRNVARGDLEGLVRGMTQSAEYRRLRTARSATELLDQMYRGILDRPSDTTARRNYLSALQRGEDADVVLKLFGSDEYQSAGNRGSGQDLALAAEGNGMVVWGGNGKYESLHSVSATLGRDGRAKIDLTGATSQTLTGIWTREGADRVNLAIPDVAGHRLNATATMLLDGAKLARFEMIGGTLGARESAVMTFVADDYQIPRAEVLCHQEARAQLEDQRGAPMVMLFLEPESSRVSSGRQELAGNALGLADPSRYSYTCAVDTRRGQVLDASIQRR